uniref:Ig-like domain-containing protein n=1 Tax=Oncorhynchus tshawytscha TaxID=74940 RepID=A0AAZ3SW66_ONCTS
VVFSISLSGLLHRLYSAFHCQVYYTGCLSSFKVTGYSGGTVIIYCHYSTEDRSHDKYFCLGQNHLRCKDQIRTGLRNTWVHSGRFSLYDNTGGNYFKVIIRQLTRQDEGTYWCGRFSTVTISDLTEDDTGTYWCGVETSRTEQRYITLITQVKLLVISEFKLPLSL